MYLYNKNILEYAQIVVTHANSRNLDIEGHSNSYAIFDMILLHSIFLST